MINPNDVFFLVAPGFDEEAVVPCLCQLRQHGTAVTLVGSPAGLVTGASGLTVRPDCSLAQLVDMHSRLLIIPGGRACATKLLSDPRVHQAIAATFANECTVAAMSPIVQQILSGVGLLTPITAMHFITQGHQETAVFIQHLIDHQSNHMGNLQ